MNKVLVFCIISLVLIGLGALLYLYKSQPIKQTGSMSPFKPYVSGYVRDIGFRAIDNFVMDMHPDEVRALLIIDKKVYENKQTQLKRAMELYSLIDQRIFSRLYDQFFSKLKDKPASNDELGGILLAHYTNGRKLELYTMSATAVNTPISVGNQQFTSKNQAREMVVRFYLNFKRTHEDYLVVIINGPNLTDLDEFSKNEFGQTILAHDSDNGNESFGMYDGALPSWLTYHTIKPSDYNRKQKQQIRNVSSVAYQPEFQKPWIPDTQNDLHIRPKETGA